ncbi:Holliday junction branch migration protein RuvA [Campylobacter sp. MIT 99-7217]|uniref:Holliday junction branch migration protein RuvA n=1 Tax=Campylobacter sp. MIT 99-7217 TaxID=535091 RepID=UPI001157E6E3|nr:Holliday junction branch migration protein RuvA [Campylobacter sp. MIT 99-7217]TQR34633.1 Holliday junction branch migration protein RuvA [Campylobacter sp. MIT 99-7217]
MIYAIEGIVTQKEPTFVIIKTSSGLSYGVFVSLFCSTKIEKGAKIELFTTQIIKEDSQKLYGFLEKNEQQMFELLLKVNGIGASTAMAVCSTLDVNSFYKALNLGDESAFKKVAGIGVKVAKRILVELSDKKINLENIDENKSKAMQALLTLGFKQDKILQVLKDCTHENTSDLIKEALKKLS